MKAFVSQDRDSIIREIMKQLKPTLGRTGQVLGALRNRAFVTSATSVPTVPTAANPLFVGAALLQCKGSGIFRADVRYSCTGMTAADTIDTTITTQTNATLGFTQATKVGPGTPDVAHNPLQPNLNGAYVSSAAGGILVTGGPFGSLTQYDSGTQVLATGATTYEFGWSGLIMNSVSATTETPFTVGNHVALLVAINRSAHTQTFASFAVSLQEMP